MESRNTYITKALEDMTFTGFRQPCKFSESEYKRVIVKNMAESNNCFYSKMYCRITGDKPYLGFVGKVYDANDHKFTYKTMFEEEKAEVRLKLKEFCCNCFGEHSCANKSTKKVGRPLNRKYVTKYSSPHSKGGRGRKKQKFRPKYPPSRDF